MSVEFAGVNDNEFLVAGERTISYDLEIAA